jgi:hypothetical protein
MTKGQFEILLARLDVIDERLRLVELDQAGSRAVRKARQTGDLELKWRLGIIGSIVGSIITALSRLVEMMGSNGGK